MHVVLCLRDAQSLQTMVASSSQKSESCSQRESALPTTGAAASPNRILTYRMADS